LFDFGFPTTPTIFFFFGMGLLVSPLVGSPTHKPQTQTKQKTPQLLFLGGGCCNPVCTFFFFVLVGGWLFDPCCGGGPGGWGGFYSSFSPFSPPNFPRVAVPNPLFFSFRVVEYGGCTTRGVGGVGGVWGLPPQTPPKNPALWFVKTHNKTPPGSPLKTNRLFDFWLAFWARPHSVDTKRPQISGWLS